MSADPSFIAELRLTAFKSFSEAVLPLDEMTVVVGRNGSGKSNALDGLAALAQMARGQELRDALDASRDGPTVRGGAAGCVPFGEGTFSLGCDVVTGGKVIEYDVEVKVQPTVQVVRERLAKHHGTDPDDHSADVVYLETQTPRQDSGDIDVKWKTGTKGRDRIDPFRATQLAIAQVLSRIPATPGGQLIHLAAAQVRSALRSVFILDPVPHLMRQYVPRRDVTLHRNAENLSAAVASLLEVPATRDQLVDALKTLNEQEIAEVQIASSELDDVMLNLLERTGSRNDRVSARVMSDGTLRFLAVLVALMQEPASDTAPESLSAEEALGQTMVVIEELENGLHASQAAMLIGRIRDLVKSRRVRVLATAHSPALLDALRGDEHRNVIVCQRDKTGRSALSRLTELPNYVRVVAHGGLGAASIGDELRRIESVSTPDQVLDEIFGR